MAFFILKYELIATKTELIDSEYVTCAPGLARVQSHDRCITSVAREDAALTVSAMFVLNLVIIAVGSDSGRF